MIERVKINGEPAIWNGSPVVYCGSICGEGVRLSEGEIEAREAVGMGAPICFVCRMAIVLEHVAADRLGGTHIDFDHSIGEKYLRKMVRDLERHNYPDKKNPWGYE